MTTPCAAPEKPRYWWHLGWAGTYRVGRRRQWGWTLNLSEINRPGITWERWHLRLREPRLGQWEQRPGVEPVLVVGPRPVTRQQVDTLIVFSVLLGCNAMALVVAAALRSWAFVVVALGVVWALLYRIHVYYQAARFDR